MNCQNRMPQITFRYYIDSLLLTPVCQLLWSDFVQVFVQKFKFYICRYLISVYKKKNDIPYRSIQFLFSTIVMFNRSG